MNEPQKSNRFTDSSVGTWLPVVALVWTSLGLVVSAALALLVMNSVIDVSWDDDRFPLFALCVVIPFCLLSLLVAGVSSCLHRDSRSTIAVCIGLLGIVAAIFLMAVIAIGALASQPV